MAFLDNIKNLFAARLKKQPERDTYLFPRLQYIGQFYNQRAQAKQVPANLRYFSRTIYARRGIKALTDPIKLLEWEIAPCKGVKLSKELERQIAIVTECFKRPNRDDSFTTLIEKLIEDYCIYGAGVVEQQLSNNDLRPLWIYPVDAQSIQIYAQWDGSRSDPRYMQTIGYSNVGLTQGIDLRDDEIIYMVSNPSNETPYGFGPIEIAFQTISRKIGVETYAGNLTNNATPSKLVQIKGVSDEGIRSFRQYWNNYIEGQGKLPFIGGNDDINTVELHSANDDALYLKFQDFLIRELATAFNISPQNFGLESSINRATAEVAEDRDWDQSIKPLASLIAEYFTRNAIHKKLGFFQLEFRFCGLDREDEVATSKIYETYYKNNLITPNEQRERLGMPKSTNTWGDKAFADVEIEIAAARGVKEVNDKDISKTKEIGKQTSLDDESESN